MSSIVSYTAKKVSRVLPDTNSSDDSAGINIESDEEEEDEKIVKICELFVLNFIESDFLTKISSSIYTRIFFNRSQRPFYLQRSKTIKAPTLQFVQTVES